MLKKGKLAVFDSDENYMKSFLEYVEEKKGMPFEMQMFTKKNLLLQYLEDSKPQLLLVAADEMSQDLEDCQADNIVILADEEVLSSFSKYKVIYKYQSMENIVRQIMDCYVDINEENSYIPISKNKAELIGVYSPVGNVGKTCFSMAMAQTLSSNSTVLYINMQEYSGMDRIYDVGYGANLSDLMYFYKQAPDSLPVKLKAVTYSMDGVDYIPPMVYSGDLRNIDTGQWIEFVESISALTDYDKIVIEFGQALNNPIMLLESCNRIFIPVLEDWMNKCKIMEWEEYLLRTGYEQILDKVKKISIPEIKPWNNLDEYKENYMWGCPGDYIRQILKGDNIG